MVITLNGKPCSGKSTIAKLLQEKYEFTRISMGDMFKAEAKKRGMNAEEFTAYRLQDPSFDIFMDSQIPNFIAEQQADNIILESRVAWHFMPDAFNVFIDVDDNTMAERLVNSDRTGREKYTDLAEAKRSTTNRWEMELEVYKKTYNIDCANFSNYDLVIDSSHKTPEEIVEEILEKSKEYYKK